MRLAANPSFFQSIIYIIVLLNADKTLFLISVDTTQACCTDRLGFLSHIPVHLLSALTCPSLGPSLGPSLVNSCRPSVPGGQVCVMFSPQWRWQILTFVLLCFMFCISLTFGVITSLPQLFYHWVFALKVFRMDGKCLEMFPPVEGEAPTEMFAEGAVPLSLSRSESSLSRVYSLKMAF